MESRELATLFIFGRMNAESGKHKLKKAVMNLKPKDLQRAWLIRESSQGGEGYFLTVDLIIYNERTNEWIGYNDNIPGSTIGEIKKLNGVDTPFYTTYRRINCDGKTNTDYDLQPIRFTFTPNGWNEVNGSDVELNRQLIEAGVNKKASEAGMKDVDSLLFILEKKGFLISNRIVPQYKKEQSNKAEYETYRIDYEPLNAQKSECERIEQSNKNVSTDEGGITGKILSLPPEIARTLICTSLSNKIPMDSPVILNLIFMKDPVVWKQDGCTYEREYLVKQGYVEYDGAKSNNPNNVFYPDLRLKNIIQTLSLEKNNDKKIDLIIKEIECPLSLCTLRDPMISPSGISYERNDINTQFQFALIKNGNILHAPILDPATKKFLIYQNDVIQNRNLKTFIEKFHSKYRPEYQILVVI